MRYYLIVFYIVTVFTYAIFAAPKTKFDQEVESTIGFLGPRFNFYDDDKSNYITLKSPTIVGSNKTITFPDITGILLTEASTASITNKTIVVTDNTVTTAAAGNLGSTELNAALAELQGDIDTTNTNVGTVSSDLSTHISDTANPHSVTATQVGLGDVDNTSDLDKPISTDQQAAIDAVQESIDDHVSETTGAHAAVAISSSATGNLIATNVQSALEEHQLDLDNIDIDFGLLESDLSDHISDTANPHSVTATQVGLGDVDNTSDLDKPISTDTQTALDLKFTNSMSTGKLLGRSTSGTGAIEEITLGDNLEFDGTTLDVVAGGGSYIVDSTPIGTIIPYTGGSIPDGYVLCDGSAISRSAYLDLFTVIGTTWGSGDGSTTFNVPDLRGRFLRGAINIANVTGSGTPSSNNTTFTAHGYNRTGMKVRVVSGTLTGLSTSTDYYVIVVDENTLAFAASYADALAGTKIAISGTNSAVIKQNIDPDAASRVASAPGGNTGAGVGTLETDAMQGHWHKTSRVTGGSGSSYASSSSGTSSAFAGNQAQTNTHPGLGATNIVPDLTSGTPRVSEETRPTNVTVNYIIKYATTTELPITVDEDWGPTVPSFSNLPGSGANGEVRQVYDEKTLYRWNDGTSIWEKFGDDLATLSDVDLTSPATGDMLIYNSTSGKWENRPNRSTTKYLSANLTSGNSNVTDLAFSNLIVGRRYQVLVRLAGQTDASAQIVVTNNSVEVAYARHGQGANNVAQSRYSAVSPPFVAAATTLVTAFSETGTTTLYGGLGVQSTYITLVELNNEIDGNF